MKALISGSSGLLLLTSGIVFAAGLTAQPQPQPKQTGGAAEAQAKFAKDVLPLLGSNCLGCHSGEEGSGSITFEKTKTAKDLLSDPDLWDRVLVALRSKSMPPPGAKPLSEAERGRLMNGIHDVLLSESTPDNPGKVTIRRLNRFEYARTVKDLLYVDLNPAADFPSDDVGEGFDNIGDVLTLSPLHLDGYLRAAEQLSEAAIVIPKASSTLFEAGQFKLTGSVNPADDGLGFFSQGVASVTFEAKSEGPYRVVISAYGMQAGPEACKMDLILNNQIITTFTVAAEQAKPAVYEMPVDLKPGRHTFAIRFPNDYYDPNFPDPKRRDRNLVLMNMKINAPAAQAGALPRSHRELIPRTPIVGQERSTAKDSLRRFMTRAYRRPVQEPEVEKLLKLFDLGFQRGGSMEQGMRLAVQGVLTSPNFLFRLELDDRPVLSKAVDLNAWQIASRLSYFLWGSMPDEALFAKAADGSLLKPEVLKAETQRMLADPKAEALADSFALQWLEIERLSTRLPDPKKYPTWSEEMKKDMVTETRLFVVEVMKNNRSIMDFIDGPYTFLNERLAKHYGIQGVRGEEFRKVSLEGTPRGGILTQGSVLTATSNPTRTSPVKRGKWVLDAILGSPPPPPPPGVSVLLPEIKENKTLTMREKLVSHLKDPVCASCHVKMDPIGFGLENFDGVGAWREMEEGAPVDSSGTMPGGQKFSGPTALKKILRGRSDDFSRTFASRLLTYAIGRGLKNSDRQFVETISASGKASGHLFNAYVQGVVQSDAFRRRPAQETRK